MDWMMTALQGGLDSLASYLAAHVLLCLVPAFFIAGALSALVPQQSIIRFLGPQAPGWMSYSAAAGAGSLLAVCSCTIQPLFAGIYRKGAGLGPAITFLFFAPAANILALAFGIGVIMAIVFRETEQCRYAVAFAGVLASVHLLLLADHWLILIIAWAAVGMLLQHLLGFYREPAECPNCNP